MPSWGRLILVMGKTRYTNRSLPNIVNHDLNNILSATRVLRSLVLGSALVLSLGLISVATGMVLVSAQMKGSNLSNSSNTIDTFTSSGKISSLIFVHEKPAKEINSGENKNNNSKSDIAAYSANATKFVLSGNWDLKVDKGKVTDFTAKFVKVLANGSRWHTHEIANLKSNKTGIELKPDKTASFSGTVDIKLNNTSPWNGTNVNVMFSKGKTIEIVLDNNATGNHFQGQPIYGTVDSIKDGTGKEMLVEQNQIITKLEK